MRKQLLYQKLHPAQISATHAILFRIDIQYFVSGRFPRLGQINSSYRITAR